MILGIANIPPGMKKLENVDLGLCYFLVQVEIAVLLAMIDENMATALH